MVNCKFNINNKWNEKEWIKQIDRIKVATYKKKIFSIKCDRYKQRPEKMA